MTRAWLSSCAALAAICAAPAPATSPRAAPEQAVVRQSDQSDAQILAQRQIAAQFHAERPDEALDAEPEDWSRTMVRSCVRIGNRMTC